MRQHSGIGVLDKAVAVLTRHGRASVLAQRTRRPHRPAPRDRPPPRRRPRGAPIARARRGRRLAAGTGPVGTRRGSQRLARRGGGQCPAAAARDHRRERAVVPARGLHPGVRGVDGATHRPARHGARRRPATDDGRFRGEGVARVGRSAPAACGAARGVVHRARPARGPPPRLGTERRGTRTGRRERLRPGPRFERRPSSPRYRCRAPSTAWAAAPAPAGPPTSSPPPTPSTAPDGLCVAATHRSPHRFAHEGTPGPAALPTSAAHAPPPDDARPGQRRETAPSGCSGGRRSRSPDGIRTRATALRGRRPRPLDDGALPTLPNLDSATGSDRNRASLAAARRPATKSPRFPLGYQDSNLEWLNQNQLCCQLHHTPMTRPGCPARAEKRVSNAPTVTTNAQVERLTPAAPRAAGPRWRRGRAARGTRTAAG